MIEAIQVGAMEAAKATSGTQQAAQPQATAFEVHQFSDAYARGGAGVDTKSSVQVNATQAPSPSMQAVAAFADNLNGGASGIEKMASKLTSTDFSSNPSAMLEMTMACHQFMFRAQLTSNVANRTSDGIQQLFRQQS